MLSHQKDQQSSVLDKLSCWTENDLNDFPPVEGQEDLH